MDVPFGWALAILGAGLIGLISTIVFALRVYVWPFKSDRQRNIAVLQHALLAHNALSYKLMNVRTDAELDVVEREYKITSSTTLKAILENVGVGAASKYVSGAEQQLRLTWQGEHSPEHRQKHIVMLQRVKLRIQNIEEMMGSDKWDDPVPLRKRKQSNEWKHLVQEFDKMLADGLRE